MRQRCRLSGQQRQGFTRQRFFSLMPSLPGRNHRAEFLQPEFLPHPCPGDFSAGGAWPQVLDRVPSLRTSPWESVWQGVWIMRLERMLPQLAALVGLAAAVSPAAAAHCGACGYPAPTCCPDQCCLPVVRYRICYKTVVEEQTEVCYRPVYQTVLKECRETVCKPVYEKHF